MARHGSEPHHGHRQRSHRSGDQGIHLRFLRVPVSVRSVASRIYLVDLAARIRRRRFHLLLVSPLEPYLPALLGVARGASLVAEVQPGYGTSADLDRRFYWLRLLALDAARRLLPVYDPDDPGSEPALPVLDPHRDHSPHWAARMGAEYPVAPSRAPCVERPLSRSQPRWHADHLGQTL